MNKNDPETCFPSWSGNHCNAGEFAQLQPVHSAPVLWTEVPHHQTLWPQIFGGHQPAAAALLHWCAGEYPYFCPFHGFKSDNIICFYASLPQENDISFVDCENMTSLRVLRLAHNKLTSVHGLTGAENVDVLDLSHNSITRIGED